MFVFIAAVLAGYLLTPRGGPGPVTTQDRPGAIDVPPDMLLLSLQRAAAKNPKDIPTFLILARAHFVRGEVSDAIATYVRALEIDSKEPSALAELSLVLYKGKLLDIALKTVDKALAVDAKNPTALWVKAQILTEKDDLAAIQFWQRFLEVVPQGVEADRARQSLNEALPRFIRRRN